jgi:Spy/CpxP family protein refolding chaperone
MRVRVLAVAGVLVVAGAVSAVSAQGRRPARQGRPHAAAIQAELGLSAEQAAQMKKLRAEGRKQAIRQRADLAIARIELEGLMGAQSVDEKAVAAQVKAISDLRAASLKARTDQRLAMRRLLSAEQLEKMQQLERRGHRERAGARRGRHLARPGWRAPHPSAGSGGPRLGETEDLPALEPER